MSVTDTLDPTVKKYIIQELKQLSENLSDTCWLFESKTKRFYLKSSAKLFFSTKKMKLDKVMKLGKSKSYFLGMNLIEWPYRVIWNVKKKGRTLPPRTLILKWEGHKIQEIENGFLFSNEFEPVKPPVKPDDNSGSPYDGAIPWTPHAVKLSQWNSGKQP